MSVIEMQEQERKSKMFNWLLSENHAISILKKDHDAVKDIFDQFKKTESPATRKSLIHKAVDALKIHALIEEELFYPAVRPQVGDVLMNEADEEHHVAKLLIAELDQSESDDHRDAKFTVLAEGVRHHIKEEEGQIFPKAREFDIDFETLGQRMMDRKKELLKIGVPSDAEHHTVAKAAGNTDSPAAMARQRKASGGGRRKTSSPESRHNKKPSARSARKGGTHANVH
jgi:hemerythrin superfamily protein